MDSFNAGIVSDFLGAKWAEFEAHCEEFCANADDIDKELDQEAGR